jgi:hypothetical protein
LIQAYLLAPLLIKELHTGKIGRSHPCAFLPIHLTISIIFRLGFLAKFSGGRSA